MQSREHSPAPSDASASREELYKTTSEINTTISDLTLQLVKVKDDVMNLKVEKQQLQTKNAELQARIEHLEKVKPTRTGARSSSHSQ